MYDIRNLDIWKKEPERRNPDSELADIDISELNLSVRSYNCLKRTGCHTVGQLLALLEEDENALRKIRNLGRRSEREILESVERVRETCSGRNRGGAGSRKVAPGQSIIIRPAKRVCNAGIEQFPISDAILARLKKSGVHCVRDLYEGDLRHEPGWYDVRELFEKILSVSPVSVK